MKKLSPLMALLALIVVPTVSLAGGDRIVLQPIGTYASTVFDNGAAEIVAYDPGSERLFVVNAGGNRIDVLNIKKPANPRLLFSIDLAPYGDGGNSVAIGGLDARLAVAVQADPATDPGSVVFFDTDGRFLARVAVGALPDMVTFTPDGTRVLVANEGEPSDDYAVDPMGTVSIIDVSNGVAAARVSTVDFAGLDAASLDPSVRLFGPNANPSQNFEPEYIALSADSKTAWVVLQENNALAIIDVASASLSRVVGLGTKDHSLPGNGIDASDRDDAIDIATWPVRGFYQPDAIASFRADGRTLLITANEGDARDYDGFSEQVRVKDLQLDPEIFPDAADLQLDENLGRLKTTTADGDTDDDGKHEEIYAFGARSFSVWSADGALVYDSGDALERLTAKTLPDRFNSSAADNDSFDGRSDDKGPEPEGVVVGQAFGRTLAFVGLERVGGVVVYDLSDPANPVFESYVNNRNFDVAANTAAALDLGPEGLLFIPGKQSPNGKPLLVVANEVSGTVTIYRVRRGS